MAVGPDEVRDNPTFNYRRAIIDTLRAGMVYSGHHLCRRRARGIFLTAGFHEQLPRNASGDRVDRLSRGDGSMLRNRHNRHVASLKVVREDNEFGLL